MATPYSQQASAGAEYLLAKNLTLRADYLFVMCQTASNAKRQFVASGCPGRLRTPLTLVSKPDPTANRARVFSSGRLNTQFGDIYQLQNSANSTYNGVSFTLNRRDEHELAFSASYTLSKTFDDASDFDEQPQNPFDLRAENAVSRQHQQQRFVFNALWELPIGDEEDKGEVRRNTGCSRKPSAILK